MRQGGYYHLLMMPSHSELPPVRVVLCLDPTPTEAEQWISTFEHHLREGGVRHLSTDIETPDKDVNEDELDGQKLQHG